jgi:hypothetical protein
MTSSRNVISMSPFYTIMTLRAKNTIWKHMISPGLIFFCGSIGFMLHSRWFIYSCWDVLFFSDNSNRFGYVEQVLKVNFILLCVLMKWGKKYHAVVKIVDSKLIPITYIWPLTFLVWYNHFNKIGIFELVQWTLNNCASYFLRFNFVNIKRSK